MASSGQTRRLCCNWSPRDVVDDPCSFEWAPLVFVWLLDRVVGGREGGGASSRVVILCAWTITGSVRGGAGTCGGGEREWWRQPCSVKQPFTMPFLCTRLAVFPPFPCRPVAGFSPPTTTTVDLAEVTPLAPVEVAAGKPLVVGAGFWTFDTISNLVMPTAAACIA